MAWQIFPLLFSLWIISGSADVLESIDCGSSDTLYTDENSISWVGDDGYIQNGESHVVQTTNSISKVMNTLRVFTTRKKNCYSIKVDPNGRVLLRVSFYYGNYDKKSSPPSFNLQYDGNDWGTVETSLDKVDTYEVTYVTKWEYLSVCVAQTKPNQFPFISAIEVRSLDATMYNKLNDDDFALFLVGRIAYGTNQTIRYRDDIYDRIWIPAIRGSGMVSVSNEAIDIYNEKIDKPPTAVLRNAVSNDSGVLRLVTLFPSVSFYYINMYFSEVTELQSTQKRSFSLLAGNDFFFDKPIIPPYRNFTEFYATNINISSSTTFFLMANNDSTLPPLISALEAFLISDRLTSGTNMNDLDGLAALQAESALLQEWSGDPCLPAPYSWDWINCTSATVPRVTALRLSSFGLEGLLPDFSSMDSLESIDLQNNSFEGQIPDFLGMFPKLTQLNLANNKFSGAIPVSLLNNNALNLVVTGNPDICTPGKSCETITTTSTTGSPVARRKKKSKLPVILGVTIPLFLLVWVIAGVFAILNHRKKAAAALIVANKGQVGSSSPSPLLVNPQMMDEFGQVVNNNYQNHVEMNGQGTPGPDDHTAQRQ